MSGILQLGYDYSSNETRALSVDTNGKMDIDVQVEDLIMKANDGNDGSGTDRTVKCDANGELQVAVSSTALPTGASTLAEQQAQTALLTTMDADTSALAGCVGGSELQVDIVSSALPTGASTLAEQQAQTSLLTTMDADTSALAGCVGGSELQVDIVSSALPSGAATEATLATIDADTSALAGCVGGSELQCDIVSSALPTGASTLAEQQAQTALLTSMDADTSALAGCVGGSELQVDIVSSALPTGAATEATLANISVNSNDLAGCVGGSELQCDIVSSALPSGAATEATLANLEGHMTDGNQIAQIKANTAKDGSGTSFSPLVDNDGHLQVDVLSGGGGGTQHAAGDAIGTTPTGTLAIGKDSSNNAQAVATDTSGHLQVDVLSSALPTGAATESTLSSIDTTTALLATEATLTQIDADTSALAGCVGGTELQVDVVSSALPTGAATSGNQSTVISTIGAGNSLLSTINGKTRTSANTTTSQTSIAVSAGGSAVSTSIDTENYAKWSVVCADNSSGNLHFIVQQSWDNSTWFGEALAGGGFPTANSVETYEADNSTSTGYFFFTNSDGATVIGGGGGGGGGVGIAQYARYIRIQAYDTAASATSFDVRWYQQNNA